MNNTGIGYVDCSWNPITGCLHGCDYCYARTMASRLAGRAGYPEDEPFRPTFHQTRLCEPANTRDHRAILVCSMSDIGGAWVHPDWHKQIGKAMFKGPQHTFLMLTKNPRGFAWMSGDKVPKSWWYGTTVDHQAALRRVDLLRDNTHDGAHLWVSVEPMLDRLKVRPADWLDGIKFVVVGGLGGAVKTQQVLFADALSIQREATERGIPVFVKSNMVRAFNWLDAPRQTPWLLRKKKKAA